MSTAEEARKLVTFAKFPPATKTVPGFEGWTEAPSRHEEQRRGPGISGTRGVGSPFAPAVFRQTLGEYIRTANRNILIAVQIETLEGLENCEEIARVDGIGASPTLNLAFALAFAEGTFKLSNRYAVYWVRISVTFDSNRRYFSSTFI